MNETLYIAHHNDLYEVSFDPRTQHIHRVFLFPDNNSQVGVELDFWRLPKPIMTKIFRRLNTLGHRFTT